MKRPEVRSIACGFTPRAALPLVVLVSVLALAPAASARVSVVSSGLYHSCAVVGGGYVKCWGYNLNGQLGDGTTTNSSRPVSVQGLSGVVQVTSGSYHSCALMGGGTVKCWGNNSYGQLGNNSYTDSRSPVTVTGVSGATQVSASLTYTCALIGGGTATSTVKCWGFNDKGQLGTGTSGPNDYRPTAVTVSGLSGVRQITTGEKHACALMNSGIMQCWGSNAYGQLGDNTLADHTVPMPVSTTASALSIAAGRYHTCAAMMDGTVTCWGRNTYRQIGDATTTDRLIPTTVIAVNAAIQVSVGERHSCALVTGGAEMCWGSNDYGQTGDGTTFSRTVAVPVNGISGATQISTGSFHTCTVQAGAVQCFGLNSFGQVGDGTTANRSSAVGTDGLAGATQIAVGLEHACAVVIGDTVRCWGRNWAGQLGNGNYTSQTTPQNVLGITGATQVTAGDAHTCALRAGGTVSCWGDNIYGELGDGTFTPRTSAVAVLNLSFITQIAAGGDHTCALVYNGMVACWGSNSYGELGDGTLTNRSSPVFVSGINTAIQIASGATGSCALLTGGSIKCWGSNASGQLGDGTVTDRATAVAVSGITGATQVTMGISHACAFIAGGAVKCWGNNTEGEIGDGTRTQRLTPTSVSGLAGVTQISAGVKHTCAILGDSTARCWGDNSRGALGDGTTDTPTIPVIAVGLAQASQIAGGASTSCVLLIGGNARCWGANDYGQLGDGTTNPSSTMSTMIPRLLTADTPTITTGPSPTTNMRAASFTFTGTPDGTFNCKIDDEPWVACPSPYTVGDLTDGPHTLQVKQTNSEGVSEPVSFTWTIDATGPAPPTLSNVPNPFTRAVTATIGFTGETGGTFACSVDGAPFTACTSPKYISGPYVGGAPTALPEGPHSLQVRQTDSLGNIGTIATASWTVDFTPPPAPTPTPQYVRDTATFTFNAETGATAYCSLDAAAFTACTSPATYTGLTEGKHTFQIRQTDQAANTGSTLSISWVVDLTPPAAPTINTTPTSLTNNPYATFKYGGEAGGSATCSIDGGEFTSCGPTTKSYGPLADGPHTFSVRFADASGNLSPAATYSWTVDTTSPVPPTFTAKPGERTASTSGSIAFTGETGATFTCTMDGSPAASCSSPVPLSGMFEGNHIFSVYQVDKAGNSSDYATIRWIVDTTPPDAPTFTLKPAPQTPINSKVMRLMWALEPGATPRCTLDSVAIACEGTEINLTGVGEGTHAFAVKAVDGAGNSGAAATATWTVDLTLPPAPSITAAPKGSIKYKPGGSYTVTFTGETGATFMCAIDGAGANPKPCTSPYDVAGLPEGPHTFYVSQTDRAGNTGGQASTAWIVDLSALPPTFSNVPTSPTKARQANININGEPGASFACKVDSSTTYTACTSPKFVSSLSEGTHTLTAIQTDALGNTSDPGSVSWVVDFTPPPAAVITSSPPAATNSPAATIGFTGTGGTGFLCSLDKAPAAPCTPPVNLNGLKDGVHSLAVQQTDDAGNASAAVTATWTVDMTPPPPPVFTLRPTAWTNAPIITFSWTTSAGTTTKCQVDGGNLDPCRLTVRFAPTGSPYKTLPEGGPYSFRVIATDAAGNKSVPAETSFTVDRTAPVIVGSMTVGVIRALTATTYFPPSITDPSGIVKAEYSAAAKMPSKTAVPVAANVIAFGSKLVFKTKPRVKVTWVRVVDGAGNWSNWTAG